MTRRRDSASGFTLVEVLVALSLLGITMSMVVAVFSSGLRLREATRERLAFDRDARMLVAALRDDLSQLVPAGPVPMVTADSVVLWRLPVDAGPPSLVTYQWSGSAEQESLLVRVVAPVSVDVADHEAVEEEFRRWLRLHDPTLTSAPPLVREDAGSRFGDRASLGGLAGVWTAFPGVRAAAWGLVEDPDAAEGETKHLLLRLSALPRSGPPTVPDPALRLASMPADDSLIEARFRLPIAAQVPVAPVVENDGGGRS